MVQILAISEHRARSNVARCDPLKKREYERKYEREGGSERGREKMSKKRELSLGPRQEVSQIEDQRKRKGRRSNKAQKKQVQPTVFPVIWQQPSKKPSGKNSQTPAPLALLIFIPREQLPLEDSFKGFLITDFSVTQDTMQG